MLAQPCAKHLTKLKQAHNQAVLSVELVEGELLATDALG
jgi:hypothetical protein